MNINNVNSIKIFKSTLASTNRLTSSNVKSICRRSKSFILKKENQKKIVKVVGIVSCGVIIGIFTFKILLPYIGTVKRNIRLYSEFKAKHPQFYKKRVWLIIDIRVLYMIKIILYKNKKEGAVLNEQ